MNPTSSRRVGGRSAHTVPNVTRAARAVVEGLEGRVLFHGDGRDDFGNVSNNLVPWTTAPLAPAVSVAAAVTVTPPPADASSATVAAPALRINVGGKAYTDSLGHAWSADAYATGGTVPTNTYNVAKTTDDAIFATRRWGAFSYNIPVTNGKYAVTLDFADPLYTTAGKRRFNVSAEGVKVLSNFDIAASGGGKAALTKTFERHRHRREAEPRLRQDRREPDPLGHPGRAGREPDADARPLADAVTHARPDAQSDPEPDAFAHSVSDAEPHALAHSVPDAEPRALTHSVSGARRGHVHADQVDDDGPVRHVQGRGAQGGGGRKDLPVRRVRQGRQRRRAGQAGGRVRPRDQHLEPPGRHAPVAEPRAGDRDRPRHLLPRRVLRHQAGHVRAGVRHDRDLALQHRHRRVDAVGPAAHRLGGRRGALVGRQLHFFGGYDGQRNDIAVHYVMDIDHPELGWHQAAPMPAARNHFATFVYGGKVYAVAGQTLRDPGYVSKANVEIYDPATDTWSFGAPMPKAYTHVASASFLYGDRIIVTGGNDDLGRGHADVFAYDLRDNTWQTLTPLPFGVVGSVSAEVNGSIYVLTGRTVMGLKGTIVG